MKSDEKAAPKLTCDVANNEVAQPPPPTPFRPNGQPVEHDTVPSSFFHAAPPSQTDDWDMQSLVASCERHQLAAADRGAHPPSPITFSPAPPSLTSEPAATAFPTVRFPPSSPSPMRAYRDAVLVAEATDKAVADREVAIKNMEAKHVADMAKLEERHARAARGRA